jgi:hypothetical protein
MILHKVTDAEGRACHGGTGKWTKGRWRSVAGELKPCARGLHLVTVKQLPQWLSEGILWEAETEGGLIDAGDKWVARRARVVREVARLDARTARLLTCDFAEHVLPIFEEQHPNDKRPREAIAVARRFANGEATRAELAAARAAAWDAARVAARVAARAAWDAAGDAAWAAAGDAEREWQARHTAEVLGLEWDV